MNDQPTSSVNAFFLQQAREYLSGDFLPKIEQSIQGLSVDEIWWRANEQSNSIGNLLLHLSGNLTQWIVIGLGGAADHRERQTEFDERRLLSKDELLNKLKETVQNVDQVLAAFDVEKLLQPFHIQDMEVIALEAIFHVVEHFSMHTGQIILIAKLLGNKDLRFYDFSTGVQVFNWREATAESK